MKNKSGLSNQEIADKSKVPLPTVKRIMAGQTHDPGYATVIAMVKAMGGTLDDVQDIASDNKEHGAGQSNTKEIDRLCSVYEKSLSDKNLLIKALLIVVIGMIAIFISLFILGIYHQYAGILNDKTKTCNTYYVADVKNNVYLMKN